MGPALFAFGMAVALDRDLGLLRLKRPADAADGLPPRQDGDGDAVQRAGDAAGDRGGPHDVSANAAVNYRKPERSDG